jgi:hypothetical protein
MPDPDAMHGVSGPADDPGEPSSDHRDAPYDHTAERCSIAELADCHGPILSVMRITF